MAPSGRFDPSSRKATTAKSGAKNEISGSQLDEIGSSHLIKIQALRRLHCMPVAQLNFK
jgi:hypothetical protein